MWFWRRAGWIYDSWVSELASPCQAGSTIYAVYVSYTDSVFYKLTHSNPDHIHDFHIDACNIFSFWVVGEIHTLPFQIFI